MVQHQLHPQIRQAEANDLAAIVLTLGQEEFFEDRLLRQREGRGQLLVAWSGGEVVGAVYLWLEPAEELKLRTYLADVPLLTHLEVVETERNRGIGTTLVEETEKAVRKLGHRRIALAVERRNVAAERLYERLGYRRWACGLVVCIDKVVQPDGSMALREEKCHVMVKPLDRKIQSIDIVPDRPRVHARHKRDRFRPRVSAARGR